MESIHKKILSQIDEGEIVKLAKDLIKIKSFQGYESEVAYFLERLMKKNGLEVEMQEVEKGRFQAIGWLRGSGEGPSVAFNGHTDIDPVPLGYSRDPFTPYEEDGKLYGHGIENMKAGVTANIMAAIAIKRAGVHLKGDIIVENVVGELQGGVGTYYTIERGIIPDYTIVTEPTNLYIRTKHAGVVQFLVSTIGVARWIGILDKVHPTLGKAVNAIEKMLKVVETLKKVKLTHDPKNVHVPGLPKMIIGGIIGGQGREYNLTRPSVSPDFCTISVDVRMIPGMTVESVRGDIETALEELRREDPDLSYEIEGPPNTNKPPWRAMKLVMPPVNLPDDEYLVQLVRKNHRLVTGRDVKKIGVIIEDGFCSSYAGNDA
ncbi:MAG: M20 family metallopeptidase, partial [Candidatus Bathyarchaeia archaeon]